TAKSFFPNDHGETVGCRKTKVQGILWQHLYWKLLVKIPLTADRRGRSLVHMDRTSTYLAAKGVVIRTYAQARIIARHGNAESIFGLGSRVPDYIKQAAGFSTVQVNEARVWGFRIRLRITNQDVIACR